MTTEHTRMFPVHSSACAIAAVGVLASFLAVLAAPAGVSAGTTERVSVDSAGNEGNGHSLNAAISADGRFVAFRSVASNLVPGDTNRYEDVFVHDRQTGTTERVSVDSDGNEANGYSRFPALSPDGRFVAFYSRASNLVPGDTNGEDDVFVHDRQTGITERVSVASDGTQWTLRSGICSICDSSAPAISADGRFVAFFALSEFGYTQVFVRDRQSGTTERVSSDSAGNEGNFHSFHPVISADGRFVAFGSWATNLTEDGLGGVFVHDRLTGITERVSARSARPTISADGRFLAFDSGATDVVPGDTNGAFDVFVHDRQTGITERVSVDSAGNEANGRSLFPAISADGRFVAFYSEATNLVPGDTNGVGDVFVHDRQTGATDRVNVASDGTQANSAGSFPPLATTWTVALSADGRVVAFHSGATNLVPGNTDGTYHVFVHDRGASETVTTTVNFDDPAPLGSTMSGVFQGIDFGTGQWLKSGPYNVNPTNHVYFADSTGTSRSFQFAPGPRVLNGMRVYSTTPGTVTLSDDTGQTSSRDVTTGSMQLVTTGWARPSTTVTVSFTNGWDLGVDDITYGTAP